MREKGGRFVDARGGLLRSRWVGGVRAQGDICVTMGMQCEGWKRKCLRVSGCEECVESHQAEIQGEHTTPIVRSPDLCAHCVK